eukprot:scaffold93492_cov40-Tisochrysis_lutea.AAC.1
MAGEECREGGARAPPWPMGELSINLVALVAVAALMLTCFIIEMSVSSAGRDFRVPDTIASRGTVCHICSRKRAWSAKEFKWIRDKSSVASG